MTETEPLKQCVVADDVRASRETVGAWLRECGFDCTLAENGQQAWGLICKRPPDLLVTDLEMPVLCGLKLLHAIRQCEQESISKLPVLVMTSLRDAQTLEIVQQFGGDGLLQKPLDKLATLSVVLNLVAERRVLRRVRFSGDDSSVQGIGVISPTLRRLLKSVANNEQQ